MSFLLTTPSRQPLNIQEMTNSLHNLINKTWTDTKLPLMRRGLDTRFTMESKYASYLQ